MVARLYFNMFGRQMAADSRHAHGDIVTITSYAFCTLCDRIGVN